MNAHLANGERVVNLIIIGCGRLGTAILIGIYKAQAEPRIPCSINVVATVRSQTSKERLESVLSRLEHEFSGAIPFCTVTVKIQDAEFAAVSQADIVILGCKPNGYENICRNETFRRSLTSSPGGTLVSLVGGTSCDKVSAVLHDGSASSVPLPILVVRAIPNIAAQSRLSITTLAMAQCHGLDAEQVKSATRIIDGVFQMVGTTTWVSEDVMNITSSIGSSAVALYATIISQVAQSACDDNEATSLEIMTKITAQAAYGAAGLIIQGMSPTTIVDQVATKGGSTQAGLDVLDARRTQESISAAVGATIKATQQLSEKISKS